MCTIETVNGREYKVKDMAQADFGYVLCRVKTGSCFLWFAAPMRDRHARR